MTVAATVIGSEKVIQQIGHQRLALFARRFGIKCQLVSLEGLRQVSWKRCEPDGDMVRSYVRAGIVAVIGQPWLEFGEYDGVELYPQLCLMVWKLTKFETCLGTTGKKWRK